ILKCHSLSSSAEAEGVAGTQFELNEGGDVKWSLVKCNCEYMPFFDCETYEVYYNDCNYYLRLYGINAGYSLEFKVIIEAFFVDHPRENFMDLTYEGWCVVSCEKVVVSENTVKQSLTPFSFIGAFEDGYFTDTKIKAENGYEFRVHKVILHLANPTINWLENDSTPLDGLPQPIIEPILHYLYSECLPVNFSEEVAQSCIEVIKQHKLTGFEKFTELCQIYIKNTSVKKRIFNLIHEMHESAKEEISNFSKRQVDVSDGLNASSKHRYSKLIYHFKRAASEAAVVGIKFLIICDIYSNHKNQLTYEEQQEIIRYCKSRLPLAMSQIHQLFDIIKTLISSLTIADRLEFASLLVPEYENFSSVLPELSNSIDTTLNKLIEISDKLCCELHFQNNSNNSGTSRRLSVGEALSRSLKLALHIKELKSLKNLYYISQQFSENLLTRRDNFGKMNIADKMRCLAKTIEQFAEEIPLFLYRIDEFGVVVEERLSWKEWKYLFKMITAKVTRVLSKLRQNKEILAPLLTKLCDIVAKEQFINGLIELDLIDNFKKESQITEQLVKTENEKEQWWLEKRETIALQSLFESPLASNSYLSKHASNLLDNDNCNSDLIFEVFPPKCHSNEAAAFEETVAKPIAIRSHRVIVASRCEWFKRALLSGMKESINKTITVHETEPELFKIFLQYLYTGLLDTSNLSTDELTELMQLSDRYQVDCLKRIIESCLCNHIDDESALFLLTVSDQFNAKNLRLAAMEYVTSHKEVIKSDLFHHLPDELQAEVEELVIWSDLRDGLINCRPPHLRSGSFSFKVPCLPSQDNVSSLSSSTADVNELPPCKEEKEAIAADFVPTAVNSVPLHLCFSDSASFEGIPLSDPESDRIEECVRRLVDVLGEEVSRDELLRISIAADCDVNRALNYYLS
ncbi:uncharacterized protein B4U79_04822, partial [Dinothrombium tinctorium]